MPYYLADLHIHTALSPCADDDMIPSAIVDRAISAGTNVIAVCDHNSAGNVASVVEAARGTGIFVVAGIETQTSEDVHIVLLFDSCGSARAFEESVVRPHLPDVQNRPERLGRQLLYSAGGRITGSEERMLANSLTVDSDHLIREARARGAISIAAHADRPMSGYLYTLGMPGENPPDAYEFHSKKAIENARVRWRLSDETPCVVSSDAHCIQDIVPASTVLDLETPDFASLCRALRSGGNAKVVVLSEQ
jgi:3',5'-nucleoside bisphosphate phosphatase